MNGRGIDKACYHAFRISQPAGECDFILLGRISIGLIPAYLKYMYMSFVFSHALLAGMVLGRATMDLQNWRGLGWRHSCKMGTRLQAYSLYSWIQCEPFTVIIVLATHWVYPDYVAGFFFIISSLCSAVSLCHQLRVTVWSLVNKSVSYIKYPKGCEYGSLSNTILSMKDILMEHQH